MTEKENHLCSEGYRKEDEHRTEKGTEGHVIACDHKTKSIEGR